MSFRTSLYEQENDRHRHSFVNRLRTHTDGELAMNSTPFSNFNYMHNTDDSGRSFRRNNHRFGVNHHHMAGEVMHGHTLPSSALPIASLYNDDRNTSPISRSFRKLRSSTWDPGHGNLRLSPKMFGSGASSTGFDHANIDQALALNEESDGQEDEVVSFSSSSENSLDDEFGNAANVGIPALDATGDVESGALTSLFHDDCESTEKKYNLQSLEESDQKLISNTNPENDSRERTAVRHLSLMREKSSSSTDGVRRSVTFSNNVGVQQYSDLERVNDINKDTVDNIDQSPNSQDSIIYNPETIRYQQRMLQQQQQRQQQQHRPNMNQNEPFLDHINPFSDLSWSLVGSAIVRYAPCFLCMKKLGVSATDRNVLMRLNLLCAFHAVVQIALGLFVFVVTLLGVKRTNMYNADALSSGADSAKFTPNTTTISDEVLTDVVSADLWNLMLFTWLLSVVNLILLIASFFAQKAIRNMNLVRSVRFMWTLFWLLPIQIFCMIGLFDYFGVMEVYTKHWWDQGGMTWFRSKFCVADTYMTKCIVPIDGGAEFDVEEAWCKAYYNAIDCSEIRDAAQARFERFSYIFFTFNGVWALLLVGLMYVTLCILQDIISLPIVQRSKEANIPLWLTFPIGGCFLIGSIILYGPR
jgi:hypothetical protein